MKSNECCRELSAVHVSSLSSVTTDERLRSATIMGEKQGQRSIFIQRKKNSRTLVLFNGTDISIIIQTFNSFSSAMNLIFFNLLVYDWFAIDTMLRKVASQ